MAGDGVADARFWLLVRVSSPERTSGVLGLKVCRQMQVKLSLSMICEAPSSRVKVLDETAELICWKSGRCCGLSLQHQHISSNICRAAGRS